MCGVNANASDPGPRRGRRGEADEDLVFPPDLVLTPVSRRPTVLAPTTVTAVLAAPGAPVRHTPAASRPRVSIVMLSYDNLYFTKLCAETLLAHTDTSDFELIVVDNGSNDGSLEYVWSLAARQPRVRAICNARNRGFAAGTNQGLAIARGDILVLLNNDTIVPPGWLAGLVRHLDDPGVGMVGPVTNSAGNEA